MSDNSKNSQKCVEIVQIAELTDIDTFLFDNCISKIPWVQNVLFGNFFKFLMEAK